MKIFKLLKEKLLILFILVGSFILSFPILYKFATIIEDYAWIVRTRTLIEYPTSLDFTSGYGIFTPLIPFLLLFGYKWFSFKLAQTLFLFSTIFLTYLFTKKFYNPTTAIITAVLLSIFPPFIIQPIAEWPFLPFFVILAFLFLAYYVETKKNKYLFLTAFILGFGTSVKIVIFYIFLSVICSLLLIKVFFRRKFEISSKHAFLFLTFFVIGLSPIILSEILNNFSLIRHLNENFIITWAGHKNIEIFKNSITQLYNFYDFISYPNFLLKFPVSIFHIFFILVFILSFVYLILKGDEKDRFIIFSFTFFIFFCQFVPSASLPHHLFPILPLTSIIVARFFSQATFRTQLKCLGIVLLFSLIFFNSLILAQINEIFYDNNIESVIESKMTSKYGEQIKDFIQNASTIVLYPGELSWIINTYYFKEKKIITIPMDKKITNENYVFTVDLNKTEQIFKETLNEKNVFYIFPSDQNFIIGHLEKDTYKILLKILQDVSEKNKKILSLVQIIEGTPKQPLFYIWKVN